MATRSRIGIELRDGSILSVYHHWDGYPEWLGRILKTHYSNRAQVEELIDGGDMSTCWDDDNQPKYYFSDERGPRHDFNLMEYLNDGEEYAYVFNRKNEWVCYDLHETPEIVEIPSGALAC